MKTAMRRQPVSTGGDGAWRMAYFLPESRGPRAEERGKKARGTVCEYAENDAVNEGKRFHLQQHAWAQR